MTENQRSPEQAQPARKFIEFNGAIVEVFLVPYIRQGRSPLQAGETFEHDGSRYTYYGQNGQGKPVFARLIDLPAPDSKQIDTELLSNPDSPYYRAEDVDFPALKQALESLYGQCRLVPNSYAENRVALRLEQNNRVFFVDLNGVKRSDEYDQILSYQGGRAIGINQSILRYWILRPDGSQVNDEPFDWVAADGFQGGKLAVRVNGEEFTVDVDGNRLLDTAPTAEQLNAIPGLSFPPSSLSVTDVLINQSSTGIAKLNDGRFVLINVLSQKLMSDKVYNIIRPPLIGRMAARLGKSWNFLKYDGTQLNGQPYDIERDFDSSGTAIVWQQGKRFFIDLDGNVIDTTPPRFLKQRDVDSTAEESSPETAEQQTSELSKDDPRYILTTEDAFLFQNKIGLLPGGQRSGLTVDFSLYAEGRVPVKKDGLFTFYDLRTQEPLIEDRWYQEVLAFKEGRALARLPNADGGKWIVLKRDGSPLNSDTYDAIPSATEFRNGQLLVQKGKERFVIDIDGDRIPNAELTASAEELERIYNETRSNPTYSFVAPVSEGRMLVCINGGGWNHLLLNGQQLKSVQYKNAWDFVEGRAIATLSNGKYVIVMRDGKRLTNDEYDEVGMVYKDGVLQVQKDGEKYLIDIDGKRIEDPQRADSETSPTKKTVDVLSRMELQDVARDWVNGGLCDFVDIGRFNDGLLPIQKDGKWRIIDVVTGQPLGNNWYDGVTVSQDGEAAVLIGQVWYPIDRTGKINTNRPQ